MPRETFYVEAGVCRTLIAAGMAALTLRSFSDCTSSERATAAITSRATESWAAAMG